MLNVVAAPGRAQGRQNSAMIGLPDLSLRWHETAEVLTLLLK